MNSMPAFAMRTDGGQVGGAADTRHRPCGRGIRVSTSCGKHFGAGGRSRLHSGGLRHCQREPGHLAEFSADAVRAMTRDVTVTSMETLPSAVERVEAALLHTIG